jgi:hypothetical protein
MRPFTAILAVFLGLLTACASQPPSGKVDNTIEATATVTAIDLPARLVTLQYGHQGMVSPWFYTEVTAQAGTSVPLDPDHEERAIYLVDGEVEIAGESYEGPRLLIFRPGDRITVKAVKPVRMMFLGGDALEGPRHIWWNFVSSSKERIEQAKQDWKTGRFAAVPQEHEFIPLPE